MTYLITEYYLVIHLVSQLEEETIDPVRTTMLTFLIIAIPIYVILGIYIAATSRKESDTFLFIPLFLIAFPIFGLYPLSDEFRNHKSTEVIADLTLYGPPTTCMIWLLLSILGIKRRMPFLISSTFICIFIALPAGVLYPLADSGIYDEDTTSNIELMY